jgi:hypothetical protein
MSTTLTPTYGTPSSLTLTALNSLANSGTAGWQSGIIDNTTLKASDYLINIVLAALSGSPASPSCVYIYAVPWYYNGSTWIAGGDGGTTTGLSSAGQATYTIASPNNLGNPVAILNYTTSGQAINGEFKLSNRFGAIIPHGVQLVVINNTGQSLAGSGNAITTIPITYLGV